MNVVTRTDFSDIPLVARGKVRDIYDLGDHLLIVTTDRVSAFDVVLPNGIPYKGHVLTKLSEFWFKRTSFIMPNHLVTSNVDEMPAVCQQYKNILEGRSMLVKKATPFPTECVARGYITGSGWKDYKNTGSICGNLLPEGLVESQKLSEPIFNPATKEEIGIHDENISFDRMAEIIGKKNAELLRSYTLQLYNYASNFALTKGIIIADTKFEFGVYEGNIILIDEALTPDSSRFWRAATYKEGQTQDSMDKQVIRNYLEDIKWDKTPPAPELTPDIIQKASDRYQEIADILMKGN
ncbi:MAG: phosphoribosylaminoimidazolesuccinocarboxamide synthase [Deferribacteraceae bacterium]|jgi:phosphoribosylaminoimidazole-succinocarboxamide synthase|nr:phosphoribosylaminoimidazolesuccinocarboxamide synthase [Deferribacteraceae bacterium]